MRGRELRQSVALGETVCGTCIEGYGHPKWPRLFSQLGLDFVFMDSEHNPMNRETMAWAAQAYSAHDVAPLLRIPNRSATQAAMAVDLGAQGVIAPYVETVAEVKGLIGAVKYRPLKGVAVERVLDDGVFPSQDTGPYLDRFNPDAFLVIMIESPEGVSNLPDMLALGNVDAVLIGPHDFSVAHGVPEQYDHSKFKDAAKQVIQDCRERNVGVGIHFASGDIERELEWMAWGCNFIVHLADTLFIMNGIRDGLQALHQSRKNYVLDNAPAASQDSAHVI
jgi:4-hydroxy-2-oxoheptanedioate aldolase